LPGGAPPPPASNGTPQAQLLTELQGLEASKRAAFIEKIRACKADGMGDRIAFVKVLKENQGLFSKDLQGKLFDNLNASTSRAELEGIQQGVVGAPGLGAAPPPPPAPGGLPGGAPPPPASNGTPQAQLLTELQGLEASKRAAFIEKIRACKADGMGDRIAFVKVLKENQGLFSKDLQGKLFDNLNASTSRAELEGIQQGVVGAPGLGAAPPPPPAPGGLPGGAPPLPPRGGKPAQGLLVQRMQAQLAAQNQSGNSLVGGTVQPILHGAHNSAAHSATSLQASNLRFVADQDVQATAISKGDMKDIKKSLEASVKQYHAAPENTGDKDKWKVDFTPDSNKNELQVTGTEAPNNGKQMFTVGPAETAGQIKINFFEDPPMNLKAAMISLGACASPIQIDSDNLEDLKHLAEAATRLSPKKTLELSEDTLSFLKGQDLEGPGMEALKKLYDKQAPNDALKQR